MIDLAIVVIVLLAGWWVYVALIKAPNDPGMDG